MRSILRFPQLRLIAVSSSVRCNYNGGWSAVSQKKGAVEEPAPKATPEQSPATRAPEQTYTTSSPEVSGDVTTPFTGSPEAFLSTVQKSAILVANFTAQWCKPCQETRAEYEALAKSFASPVAADPKGKPAVTFIDVDITTNDGLAALHDVRCVPTYCCYIGGVFPASAQDNKTSPPSVASSSADNPTSSEEHEGIRISPTPSTKASSVGGLYGSVEGAHLAKVKAMIVAAQKEVLRSRQAASNPEVVDETAK